MAGHLYQDGCWVSQGIPAQVNEEQTEVGVAAGAGAVKQFVAGQLGKTISLPDPTNSGALIPLTYQYVQRHPDSTADLVPGTLMYWVAPCGGRFSVIEGGAQAPAADPAGALLVPAGIFLGDDAAVNTLDRGMQPGNFGFIQIGGCATALVEDGLTTEAGFEVGDPAFPGGSRSVATKLDPAQPRVGVALETVAPEGANGSAQILLDLVSLTVSQ